MVTTRLSVHFFSAANAIPPSGWTQLTDLHVLTGVWLLPQAAVHTMCRSPVMCLWVHIGSQGQCV